MFNPINPRAEDIDYIETNLYLGNMLTACNVVMIHKFKIKRVLSVLQTDIRSESRVPGVKYKYINIWDQENEDIISYFPECFEFIFSGQALGEAVFVHCRAGLSRSTAIVIGFLMKKYDRSFEQSFSDVQSLRKGCNPNIGFIRQLKLWEKMSHEMDGMNREYRRVALGALKHKIQLIHQFQVYETWTTIIQSLKSAYLSYLQKIINAERNSTQLNFGDDFMCKTCSNQIFFGINIIENENTTDNCQFFNIEPQKWIFDQMTVNVTNLQEFLSGNICCGNCGILLGTYDWLSNAECYCEAHHGLNYYSIIKINKTQ